MNKRNLPNISFYLLVGGFLLMFLIYPIALDIYGDDVDIIGVKVKNTDLMGEAKEDIEKLLRKRRSVKEGEEDFEVSTPEASLETVNQVLNAVQIFVFLVK